MKTKAITQSGKEISNMKEQIESNLDNPGQLEKLYRENAVVFKREFTLIYTDIKDKPVAQFWNERLNYESDKISWGTRTELLLIIVACFIAGSIAKIPQFTGLDEEFFYSRNLSFVVFPMLILYFAWKQKAEMKRVLFASAVILISAVYINSLPDTNTSDSLILSCIHLPLLLWSVLGFVFISNKPKDYSRRLDYLRFNGDLVVMTTIILIAGGLLSGITMGLFSLIKLDIEEFYFEYIVIWGLASAPIVGTYLVQANPHLVKNVSPVIAKVFSPLVLIMLLIYLVAIVYSGKDPYNDREFLLIFNVLLIGVMAIILFSIAETSKNSEGKIGTLILFGLSLVTIIINGIALSAILFRISEWGLTPNRLAVLGGNILILTNLMIVAYRLFKSIKDNKEIENIEKSIAAFLPVYTLWAIVVIFIFPVLFNFK